MVDGVTYEKITRKADKGLEGKIIARRGKQANQKQKSHVVLQYLLKCSDENNPKSAHDIIGYLKGCGISAERRSMEKVDGKCRIREFYAVTPEDAGH